MCVAECHNEAKSSVLLINYMFKHPFSKLLVLYGIDADLC